MARLTRSPPIARIASLAILALLAAAAFGAGAARAQDGLEGNRGAILRITDASQLPTTRRINMTPGRGILVELPIDVQDVVVSHPETVDASVLSLRKIYLIGKEIGSTNVLFIGRDGRRQLVLEITIARNLAELTSLLQQLLPGSRIKVTAAGDSIVLSGTVLTGQEASRAAEIAKQFAKKGEVVNMLAAASREQVLLKVTVSEMRRDAVRRLGINLPEALLRAGQFSFAKVIQNSLPISNVQTPGALFAGPGTVPLVAAGTAFQGSWQSRRGTASALIESLERAGLSRTLAEPNLTAISGETAKFLAGGEFPVPIAADRDTIKVEWKQFGISVAFTPFVLTEGRISLKISAEVSELSPESSVTTLAISVPGLKVRRAETTIELPSGGALAIAGLLSDDARQSAEGVPELKNLPVLGSLFRSRDYQRNETELVFLVTPFIVKPTETTDMVRPDEGFAPASQLQGLFLGYLNRVYGRPVDRLASHKNNYGFVIDYPEDGEIE